MGLMITGLLGCGDENEPRPARCSDYEGTTELPDVPITYTTEHLDIHVQDDQMFCAGSAAEYERFFVYMGFEFGVELPERVQVFFLENVGDHCPEGAAGCLTVDGVVFARVGNVAHEIAHATTCEWRGSTTPYLSEGLAESFEVTPSTNMGDPREFVTARSPSDIDYDEAGHFVRWLIEDGGADPFLELFLTSPLSGGDGVYDALAAAYTEDAEALFADYEATAPFMWIPHRQCADLEILEPQAGVWQFEAVFDCNDPSTLGPYERAGDDTHFDAFAPTSMYQSFLLEIDATGLYRFEREIETSVWIERCIEQTALSEAEAEQLWRREPLVPGLQGLTDVELQAGTYRVDVQRQYAEPHPVSLRIEAL
jgi:hypothetical protein